MSIAAGSYQYQASRGSPPEKETKGQRPQQPHSQGSFTPSFSYYAPYYDSNSSPSNDYSTHNYYGPVYTGPVNYYAPVYTGSPVYTEPEYYSPSSRAPTVYSAPYEAPKPKILAPANALMTADGKRISVPVPDVFKAVKNVIESISKAYETMYLCPAGISGNVTSDADGLTVAPQEVLQKIFQKGDSIGGGYTVASSRFVPGSFRPGKKLKPVFFLHLTDAKGITFRVDLSCIKNISDSGNPFSLDRTNYEEHTYVTDGIYVWNCAAVWKGDKDKGLAATEKYKNEGLLTPIVQNT